MKPSAVAIGTFDGVHLGHQYLIKKLINTAKKNNLRSVIVTLARPVKHVTGLLTLPDEKIEILKTFPVDEIIILPFDDDLINQTASDFYENFLCKKLSIKYLIVGQNFAFGHTRQGNIKWLKKVGRSSGVKIINLKPLFLHNEPISSSRIRRLIIEGYIDHANKLLGRFYQFSGMHISGRGIGTKIGVPTINLKVATEKLLPPGVNIVTVERAGQIKPGIINIGTRPTFIQNGEIVPEINLLNFSGKWPGGKTTVNIHKHIRKEKHFDTIEMLQNQIAIDVTKAEEYFR